MTEEPQTLLQSKRLRLVFLLAFSEAKIFIDFSEVLHTKITELVTKSRYWWLMVAELLGPKHCLKFGFLQCIEIIA